MMAREQERKAWVPCTELGRKVAAGEITDIDQILMSGKRILETEIVDALLPDLKDEVLQIKSTQRMTAYGRKQQMRAVVILGNRHGHIAVGVGKAPEVRDAISEAITEAKKNVIRVNLGCGSWECGCGTGHSIGQRVYGKSSSTEITIVPAPKGIGLVAGENTKKVLELAGVKDCWTFSKGRTRNILNAVLATLKALNSANNLKQGKLFEEELKKIEAEIKEEKETPSEGKIEDEKKGEAKAQPESDESGVVVSGE